MQRLERLVKLLANFSTSIVFLCNLVQIQFSIRWFMIRFDLHVIMFSKIEFVIQQSTEHIKIHIRCVVHPVVDDDKFTFY